MTRSAAGASLLRLRSLCALALLAACGDEPAPREPQGATQTAWFRDVSESEGIDFLHRTGASGRKYLVETNGSGAAWLDADGDGRLDLYLVQGAALPGWQGEQDLHNRLFLQRDGGFEDHTDSAGVGDRGHGMAAAAPDVDGDGDADLFVTNWGRNTFYRNVGRGRFEDQTAAIGLDAGVAYHSSCLFSDLDRDGDVDLYVVRYLDWDLENHPICGQPERGEEFRSYCHPDMFRGLHDLVYRNDEGRVFVESSEAAGLRAVAGKGLGVAGADIDGDGDTDLFVANDSDANQCWRNDGDWRFVDEASNWGVAYNGSGDTEACMGCEFADVDGDLDFDLFTANLSGETNTLWVWQQDSFRDRSFASGLAAASEPFVGFGLRIADFDLDGRVDIAIANGHVLDNAEAFDPTQTYLQPTSMFRGLAEGRFVAASAAELGADFVGPRVGRGLATADYDDDGDLDLVITSNGGPCVLLRNRASESQHWIGLELRGHASPRDGSDSVVHLRLGQRTLCQRVPAGGSYLSDHDRRVLFGLGVFDGPVEAEIHWPSGRTQLSGELAPDRYHRIEEALD